MPAVRTRLLLAAALVLALAYWVLIFVGTHLPMPPKTHVNVNDKLQHAGAYAGLAFLLLAAARAFKPRRLSTYVVVVLIGLAYGAADELTQLLVPNRSAEVLDWTADGVGLVIGAVCFAVIDFAILAPLPWAREQSQSQPAARTS